MVLLLPVWGFAQVPQGTAKINLKAATQSLAISPNQKLLKFNNGSIDTLSNLSGNVNLEAGNFLFSPEKKSPETVTIPQVRLEMNETTRGFYLPEKYYVPTRSDQQVRAVQPLLLQESLLRYLPDKKAFSGSFLVLLEDLQNNRQQEELSTTLDIQFVSEEASIEPVTVRLNHTNWPPKSVAINAPNPIDSVRIRAVTPANTQGVSTWLRVEPSLVIETSSQDIQGWGVQTVPVFISVRGGSFRDSLAVGLEAVPGSITPNEIYVTSNRTARAWLRSEGVGEATISAFSPMFENSSTSFQYTFPFMFLGFSLVGGMTGGVISFLRERKRSESANFWLHLGGGTTWGLVVAVGYVVLGINLLQIDINVEFINEFMVFGISALGGISWSAKATIKNSGN